MCFFILALAVLLQLQIQCTTILAMHTIVRLVVKYSNQIHPESLTFTYLPSATCIDMMLVQVVGAAGYVTFLLTL